MSQQRNGWSKRFAGILTNVCESNTDEDILYRVLKREIKQWLFESLEPAQLEVLDYVEGLGDADSNAIVEMFHCRQNHAATLLKSLFDLGLLTREKVIDKQGKRFVYRRRGG